MGKIENYKQTPEADAVRGKINKVHIKLETGNMGNRKAQPWLARGWRNERMARVLVKMEGINKTLCE